MLEFIKWVMIGSLSICGAIILYKIFIGAIEFLIIALIVKKIFKRRK